MTSRSKKILSEILLFQSRLVLKRYKPRIVAITGSVGKTSTKDAIYTVLSTFYHTRKAAKSYNTEIGLPLTVLGVPNAWNNWLLWLRNILRGFWLIIWPHRYPKWLILETGVGKPGDMQQLASQFQADIIVFTAISEIPVHIEFFESRDELVAEKQQLLRALKPDGTILINADDDTLFAMKENKHHRVVTYGFGDRADMRASNEGIHYTGQTPTGMQFKLDYRGNSIPVVIDGLFGKNHLYATLAACTVASVLGLDMLRVVEALKTYDNPPGRMNVLAGIKGSQIIDDTYNSSPDAVRAALDIVNDLTVRGRKIIALGDMLELGRHTTDAHVAAGKQAGTVADVLVLVGKRATSFEDGALEAGMDSKRIHRFSDARSAGKFIEQMLQDGDLVLVKGSQGIRMERTVQEIMAHPERREELLVRQEPEWLAKP